MSIGTVLAATTRTAKVRIVDLTTMQGAYIELKHPRGPLLAQITALTRTAESEIADVDLLGHSDGKGGNFRCESPPDIGAEIRLAEPTLIRDVLGVQARTTQGLYIGKIYKQDIKVFVPYPPLISQHAAVIAKTGQGKSYTVGVIVEELLKRNVPVVVIDPHGEYVQAAFQNDNIKDMKRMKQFGVIPRGYFDRMREFSPETGANPTATALRFDEHNLDVDDISALTSIGESDAQRAMLERAMYYCRRLKQSPTISRLIQITEREKTGARYRVIRELNRVKSMPLFQDIPTKLRQIVKHGLTVINLRGAPEEVQHFVVSVICKRVFEAAKLGKLPPCFIIIEEAHNFVPQLEKTVASKPIATVAREGRKFGVGLCVVSQRTAKVNKDVLAQCGTHIIHKLTNPTDIEAVQQSLEGFTMAMAEEVQMLPVGVAIISTVGLPYPVTVEVRPRESKHGGHQRVV